MTCGSGEDNTYILSFESHQVFEMFFALGAQELTFNGRRLKANGKIVMGALLNGADPEHGYRYIKSAEYIAEQCSLTAQSVRPHIISIEKTGLIRVDRQRGKPNIYYCNVALIRGLYEMWVTRQRLTAGLQQ